MFQFALSILAAVRVFVRSRCDIAVEVPALRQQLAVLKRKRPRPTVNSLDRLFWITLRHCWSHWTDVLVIVEPETVIGWHRAGFRLYCRWRSLCVDKRTSQVAGLGIAHESDRHLRAAATQSDPRVSSSRTRSFGAPPTPERARVTMAPSVSFN